MLECSIHIAVALVDYSAYIIFRNESRSQSSFKIARIAQNNSVWTLYGQLMIPAPYT